MGMKLSHSDDGLVETHEINVTPFVDVMLVLLVIFMVAAPLMTAGVPLNLPQTAATAVPTEPEEPLVISIPADGDVTRRSQRRQHRTNRGFVPERDRRGWDDHRHSRRRQRAAQRRDPRLATGNDRHL